MVATTPRKMTVEEFLKLPEDGVRRCLINGVIREQGPQYRDFAHAVTLTTFSSSLVSWAKRQPIQLGRFLAGGTGIVLEADTIIDADLAYVSLEQLASPTIAGMIDGAPLIVGEIVSPWDTYSLIWDRQKVLMRAGVQFLWQIDPFNQTVTIHRQDHLPTFVNADQHLTAEPVLPGFRVLVADLFR